MTITASSRRLMRWAVQTWPHMTYGMYASAFRMANPKVRLQRGILCLSFDCDYEEDMLAISPLQELLDRHRFQASWFLIGSWVRKFPETVQRLLSAAHEVANHTMTHPDNSSTRPGDSRKFDQVSAGERREEIIDCHRLMESRFGYSMTGFRAPHFRLASDVYPILDELGYRYSSSVFKLDWVRRMGGRLLEMPLASSPFKPFEPLETYRLYRSPNGKYSSESDFLQHFRSILDFTEKWRTVSVVYMDPCDVVRLTTPPFEEYVSELSKRNLDVRPIRSVAEQFEALL